MQDPNQKVGKDVMILNQFPKDQYNCLIPVSTLQEVSDMHKVIINQVQLDVENDSYNQNGKRAPTKTAVLKLMAAANARVLESTVITPSTHMMALETMRAIQKVVEYDKLDVAHKVIVSVPDTNGGTRTYTGTKEIIAEEVKVECVKNARNKKYNGKIVNTTEEKVVAAAKKEFDQIMKNRRALCETKAMLRALRAGLTLEQSYSVQDFKKPFIVAIIVPNTDNPDVRKAIASKFSETKGLLFGDPVEPLQIENDSSDNENAMPPVAEVVDDIDLNEDELPAFLSDNPQPIEDKFWCDECGVQVEDHGKFTAQQIIENSSKKINKNLCWDCQSKLKQ